MKTTLWLTTFSMLAASPLGFSKTEAEGLRSTIAEQERQIRQLEEDNMKLRSLNGEAVKAPVTPAPAAAAAPAKKDTAPAAAGSTTYTLKAGDTLAKVGRKVGATPEALARLNGIKDPSKLQIGQKIKIPGSTSSNGRTAAAAPKAPATAKSAPASSPSGDTYVVRDGDTFYSIARKYKVSADSLIAANPDIKPSAMRTGQLVRLRGKTSAPIAQQSRAAEKPAEPAHVEKESPASVTKAAEPAKKSPTESKTVANHPATPTAANHPQAPSPAKAQESPAPAKSEPAKGPVKSVIIDGEMTYGEFAAKHGTQIERLNELNGLDLSQNTVLAKGSELYVNAQP